MVSRNAIAYLISLLSVVLFYRSLDPHVSSQGQTSILLSVLQPWPIPWLRQRPQCVRASEGYWMAQAVSSRRKGAEAEVIEESLRAVEMSSDDTE